MDWGVISGCTSLVGLILAIVRLGEWKARQEVKLENLEQRFKNSDGKRDEYGLLTFEKSYDNSNVDSNTEEEHIQTFVGRWTGYGTWEFNADGTCSYSLNSKYTGTWKYIPESQTLVTDILNWNWKVITVSENQWVGTHLAGKGSTITYSRVK